MLATSMHGRRRNLHACVASYRAAIDFSPPLTILNAVSLAETGLAAIVAAQ